jgi:hypothetical protein
VGSLDLRYGRRDDVASGRDGNDVSQADGDELVSVCAKGGHAAVNQHRKGDSAADGAIHLKAEIANSISPLT